MAVKDTQTDATASVPNQLPAESPVAKPTVTEPTAEQKTWLKKLSEYVPWPTKETPTKEFPLIPCRPKKALDGNYLDRSEPYYLRGRGDEFNFLTYRLIREPGPITLLTGPPGTGKTALLTAVEAYARQLGHIVVRIRPKELADAATIAQQCRNAVMTAEDAPGYVDAEITRAAEGSFNLLGFQLTAGRQAATRQSQMGNINLIEHLRAVCHYQGRNHRLLIYVDEVQALDEIAQISQEHKAAIRDNLYILNDLMLSSKENLPITTILAGLTTAKEVVAKFISRPANGSDLELTPIASEHVRHIINDYLTIDEPCRIRPHYFPTPLLDRWSRQCRGHVLLANHLGYQLQKYAINHLQANHPQPKNTKGNPIIPIRANFNQTARKNYYKRQLPNDMQGPEIDVMHHIVQASLQNHDPAVTPPPHMTPGNITHPISWQATEELAQIALQTYKKTHPQYNKPLPTAEEVLQQLQHNGIIRHMQPTEHFLHLHNSGPVEPTEHCNIPIPTITDHMDQAFAKLNPSHQDRIMANVQCTMDQHPRDIGTQWQWHNTAQREPIPPLKDVAYEPSPTPIQLPKETDNYGQFGPYIFRAMDPHYSHWEIHDTRAAAPPQTVPYPKLLKFIRDHEKYMQTPYQWRSPVADQVKDWLELRQEEAQNQEPITETLSIDPGPITVTHPDPQTWHVTGTGTEPVEFTQPDPSQAAQTIAQHVHELRARQLGGPDPAKRTAGPDRGW